MPDNPIPRHATSATSATPVRHPGLLVSVRSVEETAIVAGLDIAILDLKEPSAGALAPVAPHVWRAVASQWSSPIPLSAALGEFEDAHSIAVMVPSSFTFAKMGPAGSGSIRELVRRWMLIREQLPSAVKMVAVAYADHEAADCPSPQEIFAAASQQNMKTWLVDTFKKNGQTTLDQLTAGELVSIALLAETTRSRWVLAGSMTTSTLAQLANTSVCPDWIGVRGDVCDHSRQGQIVERKVKNWLTALSAAEG
jgi:(5-formylfuran-3-yl)methyl phosphate synthase